MSGLTARQTIALNHVLLDLSRKALHFLFWGQFPEDLSLPQIEVLEWKEHLGTSGGYTITAQVPKLVRCSESFIVLLKDQYLEHCDERYVVEEARQLLAMSPQDLTTVLEEALTFTAKGISPEAHEKLKAVVKVGSIRWYENDEDEGILPLTCIFEERYPPKKKLEIQAHHIKDQCFRVSFSRTFCVKVMTLEVT